MFVDDYLQTHLHSLSSFLRDTVQLLQVVDNLTVPGEALLVAIDIEALSSSIPHELGINIVSTFLQECDKSQ